MKFGPHGKLKRCNLWDDEKRARRTKRGDYGCWRSPADCHFVHPHEKEWDTAEPSYPPPAHEVADHDSDFYYELVNNRRRTHDSSLFSDSHRGRPQHSSPSRSPRGRRRLGSRDGKPSRSPTTSVADSDQLEKLRRDDRGRKYRDSLVPARRPSSSHSQMSIQRPMPPPPPTPPQPPQEPPPARPPPPVPTVPPFVSLNLPQRPAPSSRSLSVDGLRKVWHERVELMFTSINVHQQYSEAEQKLRSWRQLGASSRRGGLSTEDEARMIAKTRSLEVMYETKKKEIFDVVQKLTASDYWPAVKPPDLQSLEAKFLSMRQHITQLRVSVNDLNSNFNALLKSKDKDASTTSNDSGEPPLKRRRLEGEDAGADISETTLPSGALEEIQDRLTSVARQLSDLQNDIFQRDAIMGDEVEARIDARLEEMDLFQEVDMSPSREAVTAAVQAETAKGLEMIRVTGEQLGEVAQEVATLMLQSKGTDDEAARVRQENEQLKAEIAQLKSSAEADAKLLQQNEKEVEALSAALQAYIAQAPPPPPKPVIPTTEYLMEELEDAILSSVSKHAKHILENIRGEVSNMLQKESASMYESLWPKIELILRMVDTVSRTTGTNVVAEG